MSPRFWYGIMETLRGVIMEAVGKGLPLYKGLTHLLGLQKKTTLYKRPQQGPLYKAVSFSIRPCPRLLKNSLSLQVKEELSAIHIIEDKI